MSVIRTSPGLTDQVYQALLDEICRGALPAGAHLVQEQIARRLGVSRQPVQQAMALLKADGMVEEGGGRGLRVAPLDLERMRAHYEIRASLDGLAARGAARRAAARADVARAIEGRGRAILDAGAAAVGAGDTAEQIRQDEAFHALLYEMSGNPLLAKTAEPHWRFLRRVMGEVLRCAETPEDIWTQHAGILAPVVAGDAAEAEARAVGHIENAAEKLVAAFRLAQAEDDDGARAS
ncbi:MAG: GntR family transcriptional regulator [Marivibrio sp.]|uniref:GntR family transcriptional regulator n=1 Tax=Marivibrio sp. TaxID=2039719 RepID=UPI0032EB2304